MLTSVEHAFVNIMLGLYLVISAVSILWMNVSPKYNWHQKIVDKFSGWVPVILQFCFGSLFSAYIILYTRSASLSNDWPFLLFLIILVISNELFRKRYLSITLPVSILFTVLFSYTIFSLPTFVGSMGPEIFIASGIVSLVIIFIFSMLLSHVAPERFQTSHLYLTVSVMTIYLLFNIAYFTNIIPPIPLAMKEIGVYHSIARSTDGIYTLIFESGGWLPFTSKTSDIFNRQNNEPVYIWSVIFAPAKLRVPVFHLWQYFDDTDRVWVATDLVEFSITGGRDDGYRGYSRKSGVFPGKWRVDVQTAQRNIIGRVEFEIVESTDAIVKLIQETR